MSNTIIIIPSRLAATRLPQKPLIKINKQNAEKKIAKNLLFKIISNNSILDEFILMSKIATNNSINKHWIKNLFLGETRIFLSEKKPIK